MFTDLGGAGAQTVQANPFLIVDEDTGAIIDPGGNIGFNDLYLGMSRHVAPQRLACIFASHADPDIIGSLDRWMTATPAKVYISTLWERFAPQFCKAGKTDGRIIGIPDAGQRAPVGSNELWALPAHFMHAEGNFQFWDPVSRILFSGDLGCRWAWTRVSPSPRWPSICRAWSRSTAATRSAARSSTCGHTWSGTSRAG
jgi:flavorubredoxin